MLVQLLEEEKSAWGARGFIFPVLRNTRHYLKQLEELNDVRALAYDPLSQYPSGRRPPKPGEVLVDIKADVSKMYPNFSRAYVIEIIDTFLFSRVLSQGPNTIEHKHAKRVRDIIMPLMIFLLEHIIIYIDWNKEKEFYVQRHGLPTGGSFSDAIAILCMWLCEKKLLEKWHTLSLGNQMYSRFVDDISIKFWMASDKVDSLLLNIRQELNSWHACIKIDPITHTVSDPLGAIDSGVHADFLDVCESFIPTGRSIRIETSICRKMPGYMHAPFSSALPSSVKLGTVISQRIRYIVLSSTELAFNTSWIPYNKYFMGIGYSSGMMGKINQRYPYSLRVSLLAAMDLKAAQRRFTSWDRDNVGEHVIPLVLGARPGTRDF